MRHKTCQWMPAGVTHHSCVLPSAAAKKQCPHFHPVKKVRVATGFRNIFEDVKARDIAQMRSEMSAFLGSRATYYRYRNGEQPLNPRQQQWIVQLFRRYGYTHDLVFDDYKDMYVYSD